MAPKRWENIGYHNYRDQDWKEKFMHHEKATGKNLWGHGSWLHQKGYLRPKSKYAKRRHGNVKNKYDSRWTWRDGLSMRDKWSLFGRVSGHGKAHEGYVRFNLGDINKHNYDNVNWKRQFTNKGWWDHVKDDWTSPGSRSDGSSYFKNKKAKWDKFKQFTTYGAPKDVSTQIKEVLADLDFGKSDAPAISQLTPGSAEWNDLVNQATAANFEQLGEQFSAAIPDTSGFASTEDVRAAIQAGGFQTAEDVQAAVASGSITKAQAEAMINQGVQQGTTDFIKTGDFGRVMEQNVGALQNLISGEGFGTTIGGLDLESMQQAIDESETGLHGLTQQFSGLEGDLESLQAAQSTQAEEFQDTFDDISTSLGNLSAIDAETATDISDLQAQDIKTSDALGILRGDLEDQAATWDQNLADLDTEFQEQLGLQGKSFTDALGDLRNKTAEDILGVQANLDAAADATAIKFGEVEEDWSERFQAGREDILSQLDTTATEFNDRLSKLSASMDYRLLGDSAEGVRFRKSKAALTGDLFKGTEQLGRTMKIKALNL